MSDFPHEWVSLLSRLNLEKIYRPFPGTNKTVRSNEVSVLVGVHNNEVSVLSGCP